MAPSAVNTRKRALGERNTNVDEKKPRKMEESVEAKRPVGFTRKKATDSSASLQAPRRLMSHSDEVPMEAQFNYDSTQATNPFAAHDMAFDIFRYMKHKEASYVLKDYIKEAVMNETHRASVVDWMCECQEAYRYNHETLYIAVRLFDVYLSKNPTTPLDKLQLVAGISFMVASKYEEYEPVSFKELDSLCLNAFKKPELFAMERAVLRTAHCDLGFPLAYSFLRRYARVINTDMRILTLARFALEVSLHYYECAFESPSKLAAASLVLALEKLEKTREWVPCLEYYSGYKVESFNKLVKRLDEQVAQFKKKFPKCTHVIGKYSDTNFFEVALLYHAV